MTPPLAEGLADAGGPLDPFDSALFETLLLEAPVAFAFYDADLRYRRINRLLADINGIPIERHIGRTPSEVLEHEMGSAIEDMLRRVLDTGDVFTDFDFRTTDPVGQVRYWQSQWFPATREGTVDGVAVLVLDVTERKTSEDALRQAQAATERLLSASVRLSTALTVAQVATVLGDIGRSAVAADWSALALVDDTGNALRLYGQDAVGIDIDASTAEVPLDLPTPVTEAIATGRPVLVPDDGGLADRYPPVVCAVLEAGAEHAWAVYPVVIGGTVIGALRFSFSAPRTLTAEESVFLEALAGQCAIALERARLYERERRMASGLARSLIPAELPDIEHLELAARYLPGGDAPGDDAQVGGDWYDVFELPSGRIALVVGDVMGKGVIAAAGMGRIRSALRALALLVESPAAVLEGLDRLVAATEPEEQIITLVYLVADPVTGTLVAAHAGHPPLVHIPGEGPPRLLELGEGSTPLGLTEARTQVTLALAAGDLLLAFSDGLVETRERDIVTGMDAVLSEASRVPGRTVARVLDDVVVALLADHRQYDDVTLLGLRHLG